MVVRFSVKEDVGGSSPPSRAKCVSSNGRTSGFGPDNLGSSPSVHTKFEDHRWFCFYPELADLLYYPLTNLTINTLKSENGQSLRFQWA